MASDSAPTLVFLLLASLSDGLIGMCEFASGHGVYPLSVNVNSLQLGDRAGQACVCL